MPNPYYPGRIWKRNNHRSFWICVWGKLGQENHVIIVTSSPSKIFVIGKMFSVHTKNAKDGVFKLLRFGSRLLKAPLSWPIRVDGRRNRRNKTAFSNYWNYLPYRYFMSHQTFMYGKRKYTEKKTTHSTFHLERDVYTGVCSFFSRCLKVSFLLTRCN